MHTVPKICFRANPGDSLTTTGCRTTIERMFFQGSLFGQTEPSTAPLEGIKRAVLDGVSWIDYAPMWLAGADDVFDDLLQNLAWVQRRGIQMYDQLVDEPRLVDWWSVASGTPEPLPVLGQIRAELAAHYRVGFDSIGFNLYRDGNDSVAWHGDRHRHVITDPIVAIVSVGAGRPFRLRPRGGGDVTILGSRLRRPVRDGRCVPTPVGTRCPQGARGRAEDLDHVPSRCPVARHRRRSPAVQRCGMSFDTEIAVDGDVLRGPLRSPVQMLADQSYGGHTSVHDDETAERLGLAGAPIEGPTHFSQIDPLAVERWGQRWFEDGCVSSHFLNMVIEGEAVTASLEPTAPDAARITRHQG